MTPLVYGVFKGQARTSRGRKRHQQWKEPGELGVEPWKLGALLSLWGPAPEDLLQGNPGLGLDVQARLWQRAGSPERTEKPEAPSPSQDQLPNG